MAPHQERVVAEKAALDEKIAKLLPFVGSSVYEQLPKKEQHLLEEQLAVMTVYSWLLGQRIELFV